MAVVSYRNSTSNHNVVLFPLVRLPVVSYRNSTSNHNKQEGGRNHVSVVSYRNSTSNHNKNRGGLNFDRLYLIEILHQTTTFDDRLRDRQCCILSKFYIKPQLIDSLYFLIQRCILSKFYIKPQHYAAQGAQMLVVSYRNSTSNHNSVYSTGLYPIVVSYRNSTSNHN